MNDEPKQLEETSPAPKRRFKKRWVMWLILLVGLGPYLYFRATSFGRKIQTVELDQPTTISKAFEGTLKVATWNIAHGRGATFDNWAEGGDRKQERLKELSKLIVEMDADLVVLNEVDFCSTWSGGHDQAETIARQTGYPYYVTQSNLDFGFIYGRWHFGNVLLSRYPIRKARVIEFTPVAAWESWVVGCKRGFICDIELSDSQSVSVVGLHLESRSETVRVAESDDVCSFIATADNPVIVAGDLNTTPGFAPKSRKGVNGKNAFEEFVRESKLSFQPSTEPSEDQLTFPAMGPFSVIDWILFKEPELTLLEQEVLPTQLSDHLPVVSEFQIAK